jgi:hypothetical protein
MHTRSLILSLWLLAGGAFLAGAPPGYADEKKPGTQADTKQAGGDLLKVEQELTKDDKMVQGKYAKVHEVKLTAGKAYQIDMVSKEGNPQKFDPFLRLEDPDGREVAQDDDGGGFPNARITYAPEKAGTYKVIATTFQPNMTGKFALTVKEVKVSKAALALNKLQQQFEKEATELRQQFAKATTQDEKDRLEARFYGEALLGHVERLAKFVATYPDDPAAQKAQRQMGQFVQALGQANSPAVTKALRALVQKTTHKELKGQVALALGQSLRNQYEAAYQKNNRAESAKLAKESEALLEQVVKDFGPAGLGQQAKDALFLLQHLSVGKKAPDIDAEDIDGKKFKLSDYRGKVVVVDFWAFW